MSISKQSLQEPEQDKIETSEVNFYSLKDILGHDADYNIIFGERSNGKTYSVLEYALLKYKEDKSQLAIIRRWSEDFKGKRAHSLFQPLVLNGLVEDVTDGEFTDIYYYAGRWFFSRIDDSTHKRLLSDEPFAFAFAIGAQEHDKSASFPLVKTILFDEMLTRTGYLPDEFILFTNLLSTIIRFRDDVKIFMLGNTVNKYCPYFDEMGLKHIREMQQGDIDDYLFGNKLKIAVQYADSPNKEGKPSDKYFCFDNSKLQMITNGKWELDIYPHCPTKFRPKDIVFIYFIKFDEIVLQCEVVSVSNSLFTYIHLKTTELQSPEKDLIYSLEYCHFNNWHRKLNKPSDKITQKLYWFFQADKVYYQDNNIGDIVFNYFNSCKNA